MAIKFSSFVGAIICFALLSRAVCAQTETEDIFKQNNDSLPTWQNVIIPDGAKLVPVYSLATKKPIGSLPAGYSLLAFSKNPSITTFAYQGQLAFIETVSCEAKYPVKQRAIDYMNFPLPGTTLDERLKERQNDLETIKKDGSIPLYYGNDPKKAGLLKQQEEALRKHLESQSSGGSSSRMNPAGGRGNMPGAY